MSIDNTNNNDDEPIEIRVRDQTGEETIFQMLRTTKMDKLFKAFAARKGVREVSLAFLLRGERISSDDTPQMLDLEDDKIDCFLIRSGMISTFTSNDTTDALIHYLMLTDEERVTASVPIQELKKKEISEHAMFKQFTYEQNPDIMHPSQLDILCELLDFVWDKTAVTGEVRVDMRLTLTSDQFAVVRKYFYKCMICAYNLLSYYMHYM